MFDSRINSGGAADAVLATGNRMFSAAKSVFAPMRKRLIGTVNRNNGANASVVPLPKAGVAPEGLRLSPDVWFYL